MIHFSRRLLLIAGLLLAPLGGAALAQDPDAVLLEVVTPKGTQVFDRARLEALPQHALTTHTTVTDGPQDFTGPLMRDLLAEAGVEASSVLAIALNDYEIDLPVEDFTRYDVIAALTMNGAAMTPRDKGPIWIVYPRDQHRELQDINFDYRWVWQLTRIEAQ